MCSLEYLWDNSLHLVVCIAYLVSLKAWGYGCLRNFCNAAFFNNFKCQLKIYGFCGIAQFSNINFGKGKLNIMKISLGEIISLII